MAPGHPQSLAKATQPSFPSPQLRRRSPLSRISVELSHRKPPSAIGPSRGQPQPELPSYARITSHLAEGSLDARITSHLAEGSLERPGAAVEAASFFCVSVRIRAVNVTSKNTKDTQQVDKEVVSNLAATTGPLFYVESWARFPREREWLFRLIDSSKRNGVLFISGDLHYGEIARFDSGAQYPLYDITSSGLTQSVENSVPAVFRPLMRLLVLLTPTTMRVFSPNCRYRYAHMVNQILEQL